MIKRLFLLFLLVACLFTLVMIYQTLNAGRYPPSLDRVAAWMPTSWDSARARASWDAHRAHIDELSPVWYQVAPGSDGAILPYAGGRGPRQLVIYLGRSLHQLTSRGPLDNSPTCVLICNWNSGRETRFFIGQTALTPSACSKCDGLLGLNDKNLVSEPPGSLVSYNSVVSAKRIRRTK